MKAGQRRYAVVSCWDGAGPKLVVVDRHDDRIARDLFRIPKLIAPLPGGEYLEKAATAWKTVDYRLRLRRAVAALRTPAVERKDGEV